MSYSHGNCKTLLTFVLLNGGVPVIRTIYFVSKERELFTETTMSVSDHGK